MKGKCLVVHLLSCDRQPSKDREKRSLIIARNVMDVYQRQILIKFIKMQLIT